METPDSCSPSSDPPRLHHARINRPPRHHQPSFLVLISFFEAELATRQSQSIAQYRSEVLLNDSSTRFAQNCDYRQGGGEWCQCSKIRMVGIVTPDQAKIEK